MGPETVNKNKDCEFNGPYAGRDLYITIYQESERGFVVTHKTNIKPASYFVGRESELKELRQRIEEGRKAILVSGMGGIGKTHICRKLFEEYYTRYDKGEGGLFRHIGYIEYNGDMDSSLMECLRYKAQDNPELNKEAAWKELEDLASEGKFLLFVDNVDKSVSEDSSLKKLETIPCAIILTSRQTSFSAGFESYHVGFLDKKECMEIFKIIRFEGNKKNITEEEMRDLEYVINTLAGRHTITVEFLAHLAKTKLWTVKKLRDELEKKRFQLEFHKDGGLINIQESYEKLYSLSKLTQAEQSIMEAFSVFPYIPLDAKICDEWLLADAGVNEGSDILMGLYQKGWLQLDFVQESYALHPVFAQFIFDGYRPKRERHYGLIQACQKCMEIPESNSAIECQKYIPFAESISDKLISEDDIVQADFCFVFACLLRYIAEYKKSEKFFQKVLRIRKRVLGEEHPDTITSYNSLACVFKNQGDYKKAEELYGMVLKLRIRVLGEKDPDTAASYSNLAAVYTNLGNYGKAEELYQRAVRIIECVFGEEHRLAGIIYNNLANVYEHQARYQKAEELYEKALRIRERVLGEEHPDTAQSYNNLARVYNTQGSCRKAEELYKKALRIREHVLGEEHPDTAASYNNLAAIYQDQGKSEKAEELYEKALRIREHVLGENHPDTAASYNNLAMVYAELEKHKKAEELFEKALKIREHVLGENHPDTAASYNNLATVCVSLGGKQKAEELYKKAIRIGEGLLGDGYLRTASFCNNLAVLYVGQEKYRKAEELYKKALNIRKRVLGEEHPDTVLSYNNLARVYICQEEYKKTERMYKKALSIRKLVLGENHLDTAVSYNNLAVVYAGQKEYKKAEELYKKTLNIRKRVLGEEHPDTATSYSNLAYFYVRQGKDKIALNYYLKAYYAFLLIFGRDALHTQIIYQNMQMIYSKWKPKCDFEQWLEVNIKH